MNKSLLSMMLTAVCVFAADAAVWTNTLTNSPQSWNVAANWAGAEGYPNANGAVAVLTNNLPGNQTIYLNLAVTNGSLTVGEANGTHCFTLAGNGGSLLFQNHGSPARLVQSASSKGDELAANLTLADALEAANDSTNALTLSGNLNGPGGLAKLGVGPLVLSGTCRYTGPTSIRGGTLKLQGGAVTAPVSGYARWFDASAPSQLSTNGFGQVTQWNDQSANQAHARPQTGHSPTYVANALNGLGAIRFGPGPYNRATNSDSLNFARDTSVRAVFSVFKGASFLLTDTNNYDFHRPNDTDPAAPLWSGSPNYWTSASIRNGSTYVNGALVNGTVFPMSTTRNNGFNLVEVLTAGSVAANGFNRDRVYHAGEQWQGEVLVYDISLSEANRLSVEQYLTRKWFGYGGNNTLPAGTELTVDAGATLDLAGTCQAVNSLSGAAGSLIDNSLGQSVRLTVNGNNVSTVFAGTLRNSGGGALSLVKNGTGTLTLSGINTSSGETRVNLGALLVNGSLGPGAVTVAAHGVLGGIGALDGLVTVQSGGTLSPGVGGVGTLVLHSSLVANSGAQLQFGLGTNRSLLAVSGDLTLGGTVNLSEGGGFGPGTYPLCTYGGALTWNAPALGSLPDGYAGAFDTNAPGRVSVVVSLSPFRQWQMLYFGAPDNPNAQAGADPDGDNVDNWHEFLAGTNPTNGASALKLISQAVESHGLRLTWSAAGVRTNVLQVAPEPFEASFIDLSGPIVLPQAGEAITNYLDSGAQTNPGPRFYRVRQEPGPALTSAQRLQWWREARFGMFLHWGPVSLVEKEISWSRAGYRPGLGTYGTQVPTNIYDTLYQQFNPTNFNADEWVAIARAAGMKYMVFTTRHHDGFSEFDTRADDYKITSALCPFGRDIVKELASACHRAGMRFGAYYSQPDWVNPDTYTATHSNYLAFLKTQVRELMSHYGRVDVLWFDGLGKPAADYDAVALNALARSLQPALLINNRNGGQPEDFDTPEQKIGSFQNTRPWESCMTISAHNQWAWGGAGDGVKSLAACLEMLVRCAGGDGNMLLNVGPRPDGLIAPEQVSRLLEIGAWLNQYGESIYGTRGGPFKPGTYGASTFKGNTVYVHILSWTNDPLVLPPVPAKVLNSRLLTGGQVDVVQTDTGIEIAVAPADRQAVDTLVALELDLDASLLTPVDVPTPVSLTTGAKASASNVYQNQAAYAAGKAVDGDAQSRWATDSGTHQAWLEVDLGHPATFGRAVISEAYAGRVTRFELQGFDGAGWQTFWSGTTLGAQWSQRFAPVTAQRVRLNILEASEGPTLWEFQLF